MQEGNVFLAGDSAHQMPPFLGQGLNSGMRDAVNLAWKMGFVRRGKASEKLLDTYSTERVPHVRSVVAHAADMGRLIDQLAGRESHGIDHAAGYGGARPPARIEAGLVVGDDPHVGHLAPFHSSSLTAPLDRFIVYTATEIDLPDDIAALDPVRIVAPELLKKSSAMVVRPDGYVAAVVGGVEELAAAGRMLRIAFVF
jgi:3-(3-hydroxy-phenyl)propionate hydroxylase